MTANPTTNAAVMKPPKNAHILFGFFVYTAKLGLNDGRTIVRIVRLDENADDQCHAAYDGENNNH